MLVISREFRKAAHWQGGLAAPPHTQDSLTPHSHTNPTRLEMHKTTTHPALDLPYHKGIYFFPRSFNYNTLNYHCYDD
jgi:hypothetical protein